MWEVRSRVVHSFCTTGAGDMTSWHHLCPPPPPPPPGRAAVGDPLTPSASRPAGCRSLVASCPIVLSCVAARLSDCALLCGRVFVRLCSPVWPRGCPIVHHCIRVGSQCGSCYCTEGFIGSPRDAASIRRPVARSLTALEAAAVRG